ncbi:hypothetical protein MKW98_001748 [Papaver atlanticum]|uniref:Uncharacterized protein n=1 Tax=Papaver atlanticum TaxID=357466 RepID=A0AAD4X926_9MAGN|nr:hypothetical protein MKW98_001748 [Papaver atlanticum]
MHFGRHESLKCCRGWGSCKDIQDDFQGISPHSQPQNQFCSEAVCRWNTLIAAIGCLLTSVAPVLICRGEPNSSVKHCADCMTYTSK